MLEAAGAHNLLNSVSTAERVFARLPRDHQRSFAKLEMERGYDMDMVPFQLFIDFTKSTVYYALVLEDYH